MDNLEKLQEEIKLTKELLELKERLLAIEKELGIKRIDYVPYYPQPYYPIYPEPWNPFRPWITWQSETGEINLLDQNVTVIQ